jgi:hypothetical protein
MLALLVSAAAEAQDTVFEDWEFSIRTDNDTLLDTDQYYTNGLWLNATKVQGDRWFGWGIANETYTASDIKLLPGQIPPDDRPYAGWTYLSYYRGRLDEEDAAVIWEFSAGCIGPCSNAQRFQNFWHSEVVDVPEAQGWMRIERCAPTSSVRPNSGWATSSRMGRSALPAGCAWETCAATTTARVSVS